MTTGTCTHCGAATTDHLALCPRCQTTLTVALVNVPAYRADLERIRPGERVRRRGVHTSTPPTRLDPPVRDRIAETMDAVDSTIATWCRALADDRPTITAPPTGYRLQCAWLEQHIATIATLEWAAEALRDLLAAERLLLRELDRSDTGWYAGQCGNVLAEERVHDGRTCACGCHDGGPCDIPDGGCHPEQVLIPAVVCERGLYGVPGHGWVHCPKCGSTWDAGARRAILLREARHEVAPVAVIARAVVGLVDTEVSVERLANRIDQWVRRGRLSDLGVRVLDGQHRRVYRLGEVFDLVMREHAETEVRASGVAPC